MNVRCMRSCHHIRKVVKKFNAESHSAGMLLILESSVNTVLYVSKTTIVRISS